MNPFEEIKQFGNRPSLLITLWSSLLLVGYMPLSIIILGSAYFVDLRQLVLGLWIMAAMGPFCFIGIRLIYRLCRSVSELQLRVIAREKELSSIYVSA